MCMLVNVLLGFSPVKVQLLPHGVFVGISCGYGPVKTSDVCQELQRRFRPSIKVWRRCVWESIRKLLLKNQFGESSLTKAILCMSLVLEQLADTK